MISDILVVAGECAGAAGVYFYARRVHRNNIRAHQQERAALAWHCRLKDWRDGLAAREDELTVHATELARRAIDLDQREARLPFKINGRFAKRPQAEG